jgi:hypothetical protein
MALAITFADITWNLNTIASLLNHQTLHADGDRLHIDNRYFQNVLRSFSNTDDRMTILTILDKTLNKLSELLRSYKYSTCLTNEQHEHSAVMWAHISYLPQFNEKIMHGMQILGTFYRYSADKDFQLKLSYCSLHLLQLNKTCNNMLNHE